jgi:hypothetical protein
MQRQTAGKLMTDELEKMYKMLCDLFLVLTRVFTEATERNCEKSPNKTRLRSPLHRIQNLYAFRQFF